MKKIKLKKLVCTIICFTFTSSLFALEIDEKLTLRILKISKSKKTILINRGIEDGLNKGDHAKFYLTSGLVARGVIVEISPTRSAWSLYRHINPQYLATSKVMNLKISNPMKISADSTKSLYGPKKNQYNYKLKAKNSEPISAEDQKDKKELETIASTHEEQPVSPNGKSWEAWATIQISSISAEATATTQGTNSNTVDTISDSSSYIDLMIAVEKYFFTFSTSFLKNFSIYPFLHIQKQSTTTLTPMSVNSDLFEYGVGMSYHFLNKTNVINKFIGFATFNVAMGTTKDTTQTLDANREIKIVEYTGNTSSFSAGLGLKFNTRWGIGAKATLDYYVRNEAYDDINQTSYEKSVSGPRVYVGLSYRFY